MKKRFFPIFALASLTLTSCAQNGSNVLNSNNLVAANGRTLFLKNCAHCHGANAHGDEGPDLHNLDWTDDQITTRIRNGKKGQMTAFAGKLSADQINKIKDYVRTLK
ncbi:MAG TPA: cytochrome c [Verrucomicrobiae bacterium]